VLSVDLEIPASPENAQVVLSVDLEIPALPENVPVVLKVETTHDGGVK